MTELTEQNFTLYENEQLISPDESHLVLLDRDVAALHKTLILVDLSSAKDDGTRKKMARGVAGFVSHVRKGQAVTVYVFDGGADPKLIGDYPKGEAGPEDLTEIAGYKSVDPSRNLHGAVLAGLKELSARLMAEQKAVRIGTLVVLAAGPDLAGRATPEQMQQAVDTSGHQVIAIGVGAENAYDLSGLGKNGVMWAQALGGVGPTLDDAASRVEALKSRFYLLSYCSPARAGKRMLRVEVVYNNTEGSERKGEFQLEFDATGFGPGCDPNSPPHFGAAGSAEPAEGDKAGAKKTDDKKGDGKKGDGKKTDDIAPPPDKPGYAPIPK